MHRRELKILDDGRYKWVRGKVYPDIIAADIRAYPNQFSLDTTITVAQNKWIPSRCFELDGKLFIWYDKSYPLTNNVIILLGKYHRIWRGAPVNAEDHPFVIDDSAQGVDYYFCKIIYPFSKRSLPTEQ